MKVNFSPFKKKMLLFVSLLERDVLPHLQLPPLSFLSLISFSPLAA